MTEAEWKEVDIAFEELCVVYLPKEYSFEFRQFTRVVDRFIQDSKPFEVEVGKEYVARFITCFTDQEEYGSSVFYDEGEVALVKEVKEHYVCLEIKGVLRYTHTVYKPTEEFKASFKPLENDKN